MTSRIVVITGALGGIGLASIEVFTKNHDIVIGIDIKAQDDSLVMETKQKYDSFHYYQTDCTLEEQVKVTIEKIVSDFGKIDVLFNIIGGSGRRFGDGPIHTVSLEAYQKTIELNLTSQFLVSKYAVIQMLKQNSGNIINTGSVLGMVGGNEMFSTVTYAASKAAIIGLSRSMAMAYAKNNIRVNVISPGLIETNMTQRAQSNEDIFAYIDEKQPIYHGRHKLGNPMSIALAARFLADSDADFVTGINLPVDGGWTAQ
ncbi:MAG: NAD(P)-dependent oxidoreductase [Firmicutes bacterium HGW-Firmicutes-20]|jgi:NAD(P)-dependent dehydrogenase (short-subunit alcohol dehydrogenase family)|nr:MAG: NAD(P)-dependent oxidoreductase [Firmicutes bacterium HGW-Firmicutes-20]PKM66598.1 MAG: NAD(P)-dependent oxidoreductase [Firmicutes bacterium HGW-Firmicutes-19]